MSQHYELARLTTNAVRSMLNDPDEGYVIRLRAGDIADMLPSDPTAQQVGTALGFYNGETMNGIKIHRKDEKTPTIWKFVVDRD